MSGDGALAIMGHFERLDDPRIDLAKHHALLDIILITLCAVICGDDNWVAIDGKTLRGCYDRANGQSALHMVSA